MTTIVLHPHIGVFGGGGADGGGADGGRLGGDGGGADGGRQLTWRFLSVSQVASSLYEYQIEVTSVGQSVSSTAYAWPAVWVVAEPHSQYIER